MKVYEKKEVPRNCSTCLYFKNYKCGHADRKEDLLAYIMFGEMLGEDCPSYWLDQHRFEPVDGKRW